MKRTIRKGVFETNSSSSHSLTICSDEEYNKWEKGEVYYDIWEHEFMTLEEKIKSLKEKDYLDYETKEEWKEFAMEDLRTMESYFCDDYLETFERIYKTESGDKIVVFGKYGRSGLYE